MSVTAPLGFRAAGVAAGLKKSGDRDVAVVVNDGPSRAAAAVFTSNRVQAAPVQWSRQVVSGGRVRAVVLNSGGANACTGPLGFQDTHATAERLAAALGDSAGEIAVCSTGLIGERLPMDLLLPAVDAAVAEADRGGGVHAADAIRTTDTVVKIAFRRSAGQGAQSAQDPYSVGGMAKGAGMLAPGLATMLVVLTTDADLTAQELDGALRSATAYTFDRLDADGCMSTNDTVLLWRAARPASSRTRRSSRGRSPRSAPTWPGSCSATRRARRSSSPSRSSARRARPTPSVGRAWPGTTCSSARSPDPTRTGAGCSRRSAPPTRYSSPTGSTWR